MRQRVLIADDSMLVRRQVSATLTGAGYQVIEAVDGEDAYRKLDAELALVVCDLNMPKMNGMELLERIHGEQTFAAVPFVMLTTEARPGMFDRARSLGAKAWLVKPFKPELFLAAVKKLTASL